MNRIDISGKCTVKSHDIGRRFGEAVRAVCKEKGLLTDVEIGIQKKALIEFKTFHFQSISVS